MESSTVSPSNWYVPRAVARVSMQWPPDTRSAVWGKGTARLARKTLARWPSRWFTLTIGTPQPKARDLAVAIPTKSAPTSPGPDVTATALSARPEIPPSLRAWFTIGVISSTWARLASSGTTPPYSAWRSIWLATTEDRTS